MPVLDTDSNTYTSPFKGRKVNVQQGIKSLSWMHAIKRE